MAPNSPLPLPHFLSSMMGEPATPSFSQRPVTLLGSPCKVMDPKDAAMGVVYSAWKALREAEPFDSPIDFEFLICEFLSALRGLHSFTDSVSQMHYTQFCQKAQAHLDSFAATFLVSKNSSPPSMTEASMCMPSDTEDIMASDSLTASTGTNDSLPTAVPVSTPAAITPVAAPIPLGVSILQFKFQAHTANLIALDYPSDFDTVVMEVDPLLATVIFEPPAAQSSEAIEVSSNDKDNSDSDEVEFMDGTVPNLSPVHLKKGKGCSHQPVSPSIMTVAFEGQYACMPVRTFRNCFLPPIYLLLWQKPSIVCLYLYCLSSEKVSRTFPIHSLLDTPEPETGLKVEDAPKEVIVKQKKDTVETSHYLDDVMTQHAYTSTIIIPSSKILKLCSKKGKAHAKGSSQVVLVKSELGSALLATLEPSLISMQLE
ncbi:uncharacterized protein LAESUDRAFT_765402 [Laetiporus sulphureus 93-53]|uniref:Uncharacterized protein n=1 Tax=Laetiporus sulphureus 93-53 TaxID=1314785 RepID=A0A165AS85_9APHY|nr:uncharacterized protein LAESUDRAFT_765402 [Laetiporus sulphureus 93-53]KZS99560.1 hypothetical protein LAESUDRAFT_765402 [Laetiporus sulphureus 93-53]